MFGAVGTINILAIDGNTLNNAIKIPLNLVFSPPYSRLETKAPSNWSPMPGWV